MIGRTLSHYQILEPLGSGGMGEVFKARDTRRCAWRSRSPKVLYYPSAPIRWFVLDVATRESHEAWANPKRIIHGLRVSPNGRWVVVFHVSRRSPAAGLHRAFSRREGSRRKRAGSGERRKRAEQPAMVVARWKSTKSPKSDPFPVLHLHEARGSLAGTGTGGFAPALLRDKLAFTLPEFSSNIWVAEPESAQ